ncbi:hypothetical protein [Pseudoalteromonas luteoviolacea]|uniref:SPOR domain-containing protein n=1 Tax=Pseudoalteromonas luteoviolacea S4054 TaxID=1129367 RepID=A0A0F6AA79_9GAMM|nr:hypothetical protein [Pseudoalteromonas luteoviolacea]AOT09397.1 hypothetical protein S4054249_16750 [Pseudoalteromonas luteoviolacea]AOT14309.1 hypothetical protein S40542_16720 [Pseudoalteromonas luteoviolacea]AOT19225.1 hypothetical protein S4054_16725 [Pseudoalteromonas luteoviolacea]KKE83107.1 hypothetical protein N479_15655 [Pseudoalteromonas luteoviolacea S4054]KZN73498.1 hypothetical protein N481_12320 [Pseudoalteromonas luteoviolacea S4047-1]
MPLKFVVPTFASIFIMVNLVGCVSSELSLDEKLAQQEALHAHKAMLASYKNNQASIERLADMEADLTQLLELLSMQTEVEDIHSHLQPIQAVVTHSSEPNIQAITPNTTSVAPVIESGAMEALSISVPDFLLGIHLREQHAKSQVKVIQERINIVRQAYPLVFSRTTASISEPDPSRNLFYVTANGFTSVQEAKVFCKAMSSITRHCSELKN